ncbi:pyridine nucleotide-disulfide oxidoreductase [Mycobacterium sp. BK086]|nr:pyridine nucleotide-disulfide oxidoreductase [Mycobacterium sp. BK086]
MQSPGMVVIGSGPAAVSAAERFRQIDSHSPVTVVTADVHPPYQRPPLSKDFLRGDTDSVRLHDPDWFTKRSIRVLTDSPVHDIDLAHSVVHCAAEDFDYRTLVIASGAAPAPLPVPGSDNAMLLRSLEDATRLRDQARGATTAVVIGAGFIGCEAAASLASRGLSVTVVAPEESPQRGRLGEQAGKRILQLLTDAGVHYIGGAEAHALESGVVHLDNGDTLRADMIVAATGISPNNALAEAAGLAVHEGRITVGADMATTAAGVYAAGDVALADNATAQRPVPTEHWQDAIDQGALAGAAAAGQPGTWGAVPGFWTTIGEATVKYSGWGGDFDNSYLIDHGDGFTVWYEADGAAVGILTHNADTEYALGQLLVAHRSRLPARL